MIIEIKIPSPGESISEVELARWLVQDNSWIDKDQEIAEVESEKATLPLLATENGIISFKIKEGATVKVGEIACLIDTAAKKPENQKKAEVKKPVEPTEKPSQVKIETTAETKELEPKKVKEQKSDFNDIKVTPLAQKQMDEANLLVDDIINGLKKITSHEVDLVRNLVGKTNIRVDRTEERTKMTQLRKKLSERLVSVKNQTAMLTTFNEVDMTRVQEIRKVYQDQFREKFGIKLGLMSFFTKAVVEALKQHPMTNSMIDGDEIITPNYIDLGIAVQTPKGLMVPVLRDADKLSFAEIENGIAALAEKGRSGRISIEDLSGGTFTITNGGIFGSMLSTPILNPPQSGILGMHNIVDRPVAVDGKVEIRPIMYVALSYDHRVIDGKDSAAFLFKVKKFIENPETMLLEGQNPDKILIGL